MFCLCALGKITAEESFNLWGSRQVFALDGLTDGILFGAGTLLTGSDFILDNVLEINRAYYDESKIYDKENVNSFDRIFMNQYSSGLDVAGTVGLGLCMLSPLVLCTAEKSEWLTAGMMYAETLLISNGIKELTKLAVKRERPYMYFEKSTYPQEDIESGDFANSFPSGHATLSFAGATFATYTYFKYFPERKSKWAVAAASYGAAAATACLRMASGNHFATDVLTGAAIGTAVGFLVPWLHTFNAKSNFNISLSSDTLLFTFNF